MSTEKVSDQMRMAAKAAPTAEQERVERIEADRQRERERVAAMAGDAGAIIDLEAKLGAEQDSRKRAEIRSRHLEGRIEQVLSTISGVIGRDASGMGQVELAVVMSCAGHKLATLAIHLDYAETLEDLQKIKRIATNMNVRKPKTMPECAAAMGLVKVSDRAAAQDWRDTGEFSQGPVSDNYKADAEKIQRDWDNQPI